MSHTSFTEGGLYREAKFQEEKKKLSTLFATGLCICLRKSLLMSLPSECSDLPAVGRFGTLALVLHYQTEREASRRIG